MDKTVAEQRHDPTAARCAEFYKKSFIDTGKLGVATGEGFYTYPSQTR